MTLHILQERAQLLRDTRHFFYQRDVLEVETPALSQASTTDPYIETCAVVRNGDVRYLHSSAEYAMKRLLVAGSGDIYQICKVWRGDEIGRHHNPEFTMLEWYRLDYSYRQLMEEVDALLQHLIQHIKKPSQFFSYQQLFLDRLAIDPHEADHATLLKCLVSQSINIISTLELDSSAILDLLMTHCIEPTLSKDCLTFIYDYPASQKALSRLSEDQQVAQRFEVYFGSVELGNGYQEETCGVENQRQLQNDLERRLALGKVGVPIDECFLAAMQQGMPQCAGVALGLDRVLMCRCQKKSLEEVIALTWAVA